MPWYVKVNYVERNTCTAMNPPDSLAINCKSRHTCIKHLLRDKSFIDEANTQLYKLYLSLDVQDDKLKY